MSDQEYIINLSINTDALKQIPQLKTAIDNLQDSISNLNKQILIYNKQNQETVTWGAKIKSTIKDLTDTYDTFKKVVGVAEDTLKGWSGVLAGIFTLVTTYGPDIINFFDQIFQSDKAKAAAKALKEYREIMDGYIENIAPKISQAQLLVNIAYNDNLPGSQIEAIKQLNALAPEYLQNLTLKNLKTKEGKDMIDEYINSLKRKGMEESVEAKRQDKVKERYTLKEQIDAARKLKEAYENGTIKDKTYYTTNGVPNYGGQSTKHSTKEAAVNNYLSLLRQDAKIVSEIKKLDDQLASSLSVYAPRVDLTKVKIPVKKNKIEEEIKTRPDTQELEATSISFAKTIELDKQHYDTEQALLQTQLEKKLISQEEFNKQSEALQEQYHVAIGDKIKTFNQNDLNTVKQQMQSMVDAKKLQGDIEKDEHDVKKAILPGDKLKAEQQLITDKYNYEIVLAAGNSEKIKQLEEQKQQDLTAINKQYEQERKEFALQTAQKVSDAAFGMLKGSIQSQADAKIKGLETQKQAELANTNLTAGQRKAIEDKYKKKEAEEKVKAFKAEQRASILQAVINGALAITKVTSQTGVLSPFVIPGIIAETAIQVATIAKQKAPQYAKGGMHYQSDGRGALLSGYSRMDDTNAYLRSGEAVVVSEAMRNPWARNLVSAINVAYGGRDFSVTNPGRGYAIGGIYTDGGNANRYYNQPVNDVKDLANTVAYQMINNFPPIYVDVKDVNSQQSILAQTINRVNF